MSASLADKPQSSRAPLTLEEARRLDAADPLRAFRDQFQLPDGVIYLDGNSLGPLPRATPGRLADVIAREWGDGLIRSWNDAGWIDAAARVGAKIAPLVGAEPHEVIVADSTSVNLFKLLAAAMREQAGRSVILTEAGGFPTDLYMAEGFAEVAPEIRVRTAPRGDVLKALDEDVGVLMLTHIHYKTGEAFDLAGMTQAAHACGALVLWDLSHSVGAVPVQLREAGADLAVGCGYKYLNGGPGAPAFLYVAERLQSRLRSPLSGWMGHAAPFDFADDYRPAPGLARFLCGTPSILGLAALEVGVDLISSADLSKVFAKSQALCSLFSDEIMTRCQDHGVQLATPSCSYRRGAHVSFYHPNAYAIMQALIAKGVIGDFREPDVLRFGFPSLYLSYEDVLKAAEALQHILEMAVWRQPSFNVRGRVT